MTERRVLPAGWESKIFNGDADIMNSYRYQTLTPVRVWFGQLNETLETLKKHGNLADELPDIICRAEGSQDRCETPAEGPVGETNAVDTAWREDAHTPRRTLPFPGVVDAVAEDALPGSDRRLRRYTRPSSTFTSTVRRRRLTFKQTCISSIPDTTPTATTQRAQIGKIVSTKVYVNSPTGQTSSRKPIQSANDPSEGESP
jgi:hypothetical protein